MNHLRAEAEKLREAGYSYNMINEALGVAKSTMHYWFKDQLFTPNHKVLTRIKYGPIKSGAQRHNIRVKETARLKEFGRKELGNLTKRDLWLLGLGIYIGEGSKTIETLSVTNSDPAIIAVAIRWFREICNLSTENLVITMHLYPDIKEKDALAYWQAITGLPVANFRKTSVDMRENKKTNNRGKLPYGTADLRVRSNGDPSKGVALYRRINGWMVGALNQI